MAEASKGRVTITLGRTGQVVKRAATVPDVNHVGMRGAGSKRSIRDRLGSNSDSSSSGGALFNNKRQRGDGYLASLNDNHAEDARIGKNDLRYKLMQKNVSGKAQSNYDEKSMDLRQKLSRTMQPPGPSYSATDTRQNMLTKSPNILGRIPLARSAETLQRMDAPRSSYSPWTLDHIRRRSPDRIIGSSRGRGLSPPRNVEELSRRPVSRTFEDPRAFSYMNKNVLDAPRPVSSSAPFMTKSVMPSVSAKPVAPHLSQLPPPNGIIQKSSYVAEEQQTVEGLLHSLGLGKYAILFKAEEVDMTALKQMGEHDLKELGIPMGPRKKILLAVLPRSRRQP
ncbi:Sterile alpha motif (SAM) domain-containing protein [Euphorbia peplus]|nr:Sterile alpha motif (SAM) domain-containing protein [Euphorbia peplus]